MAGLARRGDARRARASVGATHAFVRPLTCQRIEADLAKCELNVHPPKVRATGGLGRRARDSKRRFGNRPNRRSETCESRSRATQRQGHSITTAAATSLRTRITRRGELRKARRRVRVELLARALERDAQSVVRIARGRVAP